MPAIDRVQTDHDPLALPRTLCGGITPVVQIAHLAETPRLLADCPNRRYPDANGLGVDSVIAEPLQFSEGRAIASDRPGHGISFDRERLEGLRS